MISKRKEIHRSPKGMLLGSHPVYVIRSSRIEPCSGFTLIELLAVLVIVVMLAALLLPAVQRAREAARRTQCMNNMMQIGIALNNYMMAHAVLPPGTQNDTGPIRSTEGSGYHMGWLTQILPYLEKRGVYSRIDFTESVYDKANVPVRQRRIPNYLCPSDGGGGALVAQSNYCGVHNDFETPINVNQNGVFFLNSSISSDDITDGNSSTIFVVESLVNNGGALGWMAGTRSTLRNLVIADSNSETAATADQESSKPSVATNFRSHGTAFDNANSTTALLKEIDEVGTENQDRFVGGPSSRHGGGGNALLGDGSVRFISWSISAQTLRCLAHRSDCEMIDEF